MMGGYGRSCFYVFRKGINGGGVYWYSYYAVLSFSSFRLCDL